MKNGTCEDGPCVGAHTKEAQANWARMNVQRRRFVLASLDDDRHGRGGKNADHIFALDAIQTPSRRSNL